MIDRFFIAFYIVLLVGKVVFKDDVAFKYAGNEEMLKRLCGLK